MSPKAMLPGVHAAIAIAAISSESLDRVKTWRAMARGLSTRRQNPKRILAVGDPLVSKVPQTDPGYKGPPCFKGTPPHTRLHACR